MQISSDAWMVTQKQVIAVVPEKERSIIAFTRRAMTETFLPRSSGQQKVLETLQTCSADNGMQKFVAICDEQVPPSAAVEACLLSKLSIACFTGSWMSGERM
jgi:hypothetical protein